MPPTSGLVVGARGELSRSIKQFVSNCAEKESISPERFGCCHGKDQARGMIANFIKRAFGRVFLRRGVARVRHAALTAATGSKLFVLCLAFAVCCWPLDLDGYAGSRERVGLDWRPGSGRVYLPSS